MKTARNNEINFLKFIATISVILIHEKLPGSIGITIKDISAAAVPIFFMISGYFSYGSTIQQLKRRAVRILKLVILANAIYFIWDILVELWYGRPLIDWFIQTCSPKRILVFLLLNESSLRGHLWFLGALLYVYLFLIIGLKYIETRQKNNRFIFQNSENLFLLISILLFSANIIGGEILTLFGKNIQIPYIRNWIFMGVPCACLAYFIHAKEKWILQYIKKKTSLCLFFLCILFNLIEVIYMPASGLYLSTIFLVALAFILALQYKGKCQNSFIIFLGNFADQYGVWIYILQIMVIKSLRQLYSFLGIANNVAVRILSPIMVLILTSCLAIIPTQIERIFKKHHEST